MNARAWVGLVTALGLCGCDGASIDERDGAEAGFSCTPSCGGNSCGDDGCGGSCGTCGGGWVCTGTSCAVVSAGMVGVPAGAFSMGCDAEEDTSCGSYEKPYHEVYVSAFEIDETEVTVAAYGACVAAGKCGEPSATWSNCNWKASGREQHPVNCVDWSQAKAFCAWAGKRLPWEAEWERAARGSDGRVYPWGNESATCERAVMSEGIGGCGEYGTWPVKSKLPGASPYGAHDMAGNVWEWVADWYGSSTYESSPSSDPRGPGSGSYRVVRGGGFGDGASTLRASNRGGYGPSVGDGTLGFRCSRSLMP